MEESPSRRRIPSRWSQRAATGAALGLYAFGALVAFSPLNPLSTTVLPNGATGDPPQMAWFLAWTPWALLHGHNPFFTTLLDHPDGVDLANNTSVPLLGLIASPITLTLGPIAALNLLARLALVASAFAAYAVLRVWGRRATTAFVGGALYGFGPYIATHVRAEVHLDLIFLPIPPLLALVFSEAFVAQRKSALAAGVAAGALATAQLLISAEVLSDCVVVGAIVLVIVALVRRRDIASHLHHALVATGAAAATFAVLGGFPVFEMLFGRDHLTGTLQSVTHLQGFRVDLLEALLPTSHELVAPSGIAAEATRSILPITRIGGAAEVGAYLGIPLIVVLAAIVVRYRRNATVRLLSLTAAVAFVLSLGNRLEVGGHLTPIRLPEIVFAHLPLLDNTIPARFSALVALAAAMLFATGLDLAFDEIASHRERRVVLAAEAFGMLAVLAVLALVPAGRLVKESPAAAVGAAPTLSSLVPHGSVVLTYPFPNSPYDEAMLWQADSKMEFVLPGGYATVNGPNAVGRYWGPLLAPAAVQETLLHDQDPRAHYYPLPAPGSLTTAALCQFFAAQHIGAVVVDPAEVHATDVSSAIESAIGSPRTTGGGLSVWLVPTTGCGEPHPAG